MHKISQDYQTSMIWKVIISFEHYIRIFNDRYQNVSNNHQKALEMKILLNEGHLLLQLIDIIEFE